jgi:hypothetical protein
MTVLRLGEIACIDMFMMQHEMHFAWPCADGCCCTVQGRTTQHIEELLERSQEGSLTAASRVQRDAGGFV